MSNGTCYAFSIHKAGSTLFYNLLRRSMHRANALGLANGLHYLSIPDAMFNSGSLDDVLMDPQFPSTYDQGLADPCILYGGFRFVPAFASDEFLAGKRVMVLVRDPRDALTSLYFSVQRSHRIPDGEARPPMERMRQRALAKGIDEFILEQVRAGPWRARFARLTDLRDRGVSWRYEDVIFAKRRWLDEILDYLQIDLPAPSREAFVRAEDVWPESEDADKHIRQVTPGDHKRKLRPETVEAINSAFSDTLGAWGYA